MNSMMFRRLVFVFCLGMGGFSFAVGFSSLSQRDVIARVIDKAQEHSCSPCYKQAQQEWRKIFERAEAKLSLRYNSENRTDLKTLLTRISKHINNHSQDPFRKYLTNLVIALSNLESSHEDLVGAFYNVVFELHQLHLSNEKFDETETQKTRKALEELLYVLLRKTHGHDPELLKTVHGAAELPLALCVAYASLDLLKGETAPTPRRSSGFKNIPTQDVAGVAALAIVVSLSAYKIHTRHPKIVTINGVEYPYVTPRILRDRDVKNLTSPTEITRERDNLLSLEIGQWHSRELYSKLASEQYKEICTAVCYQQPIVYYSADMKSTCSYKTWHEVIKVIHQNLDTLEKSTLIVPVKELRNFTKLIDFDSKQPYKNQIQDIYEFAPTLPQYYERAAREFWRLLHAETRSKAKPSKEQALTYCKRMPTEEQIVGDINTNDVLHGLKRGPSYRSSHADLVLGFQASQNILEALFHVIIMRVHAETGRFYEHFPTFLPELYDRVMYVIYAMPVTSTRRNRKKILCHSCFTLGLDRNF